MPKKPKSADFTNASKPFTKAMASPVTGLEAADDQEARTAAHSLADAASSGNPIATYDAVNDVPEYDQISQRAYELYLERERDGAEGSAEDDWLRAEQEVRSNVRNVGENAAGVLRPR